MNRVKRFSLAMALLAVPSIAHACEVTVDYGYDKPVAVIKAHGETFIGDDMDAAIKFYNQHCKGK